MEEVDKKQNIRNILLDQQGSAFDKYRLLTTGNVSLTFFVLYELATWLLGSRAGALGILLRRKLYKKFFKGFGNNVIIGRNCIFRHPGKISLGDNVVIDDNCVIDARGTGEEGIKIANDVMINRNCALQSKGGDIVIERGVGLGADSQLVSWSGINVGEGTAIASGCCASGGTYKMNDFATPISERQPYSGGPICIGSNVWIATRVTLLDAVKIGDNAIISAGAVVSTNIGDKAVAHGNPAKVVFQGR